MKSIKFLFSGILSLFLVACSGQKDDTSVADKTAKSNKISILFVEQNGCGSCELLKNTFQKAEIKKIVDDGYELKFIDISNANTLPKGVMEPFGTPTIYFISPEGKELHEPLIGAKNQDDLAEILNQIKNDYKAKSDK